MNRMHIDANGVVRQKWDGFADPPTYTEYGPDGTVVLSRPFNQAEMDRLAAELAARAQDDNRSTIRTKAMQALQANQNYLALTSPTNAQVAAQVKLLTREVSGLIRLVLDQVDTTEGT
jgi:hypothetical protein